MRIITVRFFWLLPFVYLVASYVCVEIAWDEFYAPISLSFDKIEFQQSNDMYDVCICHIIEYRERVIIY